MFLNKKVEEYCYLICAVFVAFNFVAASPGFMSPDSIYQYTQGAKSFYDSWHPPFMAFILGIFHYLVGSPWPWTLFQLSALAYFAFRLQFEVKSHALKLLTCLCLFSPSIINFAAVIWKDVGAVAFTALALALHLNGRSGRMFSLLKKQNLLIANLFLLCAFLVRPASAPFLWTITFWLNRSFWYQGIMKRRIFKGSLVGFALIFVSIVSNLALTKALKTTESYPFQYVMIYDLQGVAYRTGKCPTYFPVRLQSEENCSKFKNLYSELSANNVFGSYLFNGTNPLWLDRCLIS